MKKFEYCVFRVEHEEELTSALKEKGNEGFELVHVQTLSEAVYDDVLEGYIQKMTLILKKEIDE